MDAFGCGGAFRGFRVAACQQDRQAGPAGADFSREVDAVHPARHHDVRKYDVYAPAVCKCPERGLRAGRPRHFVADLVEHFRHKGGDLVVIFDKQHEPDDPGASFEVFAIT